MAGLAVLDNVLDLDHDLQEEYEDTEEEEEEEDVHYYELERIVTDCVQQTELSLAWDVMSCHGVYLSKFLRVHHALRNWLIGLQGCGDAGWLGENLLTSEIVTIYSQGHLR